MFDKIVKLKNRVGMYMLFKELQNHINKIMATEEKVFSPIYYIYGEDAYLREKARLSIQECVIDKEFEDMNVSIFSNEDIITDIVDSLFQVPFFGNYRIVIAQLPTVVEKYGKGSDNVGNKLAQRFIKDFLEAINKNYLNEINPSTILIITSEEAKPGKINDFCEYVDCQKLDLVSIGIEIDNLLSQPPVGTMEDDAKSELIDRTLSNMTRIANEIPKLKAYTNGAKITKKDVQELVTEESEYAIYELANALTAKDGDEVMKIVNNLLGKGEDPMSILSNLYKNYRQFFHLSLHLSESNEDIAQYIGVGSKQIYYMRKNIRDYTQKRLKMCVDTIHELQTAVLAGNREPHSALMEGVLTLLTI